MIVSVAIICLLLAVASAAHTSGQCLDDLLRCGLIAPVVSGLFLEQHSKLLVVLSVVAIELVLHEERIHSLQSNNEAAYFGVGWKV